MSVTCSGGCDEPTERAAQQPEWYEKRNRIQGHIRYENRLSDGKLALCTACERQAARRLAAILLNTTWNEYEGGGARVYQAKDLLERAYAGDVMPLDQSGEAA